MREHFAKAFEKRESVSDDFAAEIQLILSKYTELERVQAIKEQDQNISVVEERVESLSKYEEVIQKWLARYGVEAEVRKNSSGQLELVTVELPETIPSLPADYGYKGGAARAILEHSLGLPYSEPRDLDIVFFGENEDRDVSDRLAKEYMPDDYSHGYGVESLGDNYFSTRDFTLNEVLYDGHKVVCTRQCLTDLLRNIVRFTDYEKDKAYYGEEFFINPKLLAKAVRMVAYARDQGKERAAITDEIDSLQELYVDDFHLALHLDRAIEQGPGVAREYVRIMNEKGFIPSSIVTVEDCFEYLLGRTDFIFRSALETEIKEEPEFIATLADEYLEDTPLSPMPLWKQKRNARR